VHGSTTVAVTSLSAIASFNTHVTISEKNLDAVEHKYADAVSLVLHIMMLLGSKLGNKL